jgi:hypothetical protein
MSREDVRQALSQDATPFQRAGDEEADLFREVGVCVYYDSSGLTAAIELASPASVLLGQDQLIGVSFSKAQAALFARDPALSVEPDGAVSRAVGVGLWAPLAKDDSTAPVESVIVFVPGYYG